MSQSDPTRTYRFLITDDADVETDPREVFLTFPERDDLTDEMTTELIQSVGAAVQRWYIDRQGFSDPTTRAGGPRGVAC
ncbi:hypothetical protein N8813_05515 [bacterium]|nr:hypothetical protein [bacterium]MDB4657232.1 hypothetical protein [Verrucomicrobiales bacterium]